MEATEEFFRRWQGKSGWNSLLKKPWRTLIFFYPAGTNAYGYQVFALDTIDS
jgi:hypothetical protein